MVTIVTGKINSGKTTYINKLYDALQLGDGFIAVKTMLGKQVHHYDLLHLSTNKTCVFAVHETFFNNDFEVEVTLGPYRFNKAAFKLIKTTSKRWLKHKIEPIYFDEVGKLELSKSGYYPFIKMCLSNNLDVVMTVRDDLVEPVIECFNLVKENIVFKEV